MGLLTSETMKLLEPTKNKITKDENGENVSYLEITGVVLIHRSVLRARILVASDLSSKVKGSWFEPSCHLYGEMSSLQ